MPKPLNLIVACAENRVIGRDGKLPWRIPEDWRFFKTLTAGKIVILGRISFCSWKSVLEDGRRVIVLTRDKTLGNDRVQVADSLASALALAEKMPGEIFVCGGQQIFEEAMTLPRVERLYLTLVHANVAGDRYFPGWHGAFPRVIEQRDGSDENYRYTFYVLGR
jgi:dihydrofolate reductase